MSETAALPGTGGETAQPATLLFVDDEANILAALNRLFRPFGYRILTAESGAQGLEIMAREAVDLVISDMRMPEMNGAQFLEKVRERWPETIRILLTGYADIASTVDAINKGQIFRYFSKPWEDRDIVVDVKHALEHKQLELDKKRLELLTQKQNEELKQLNASLEAKVRGRTEELRRTMEFLEDAHERLKKSFLTSVRVFSSLIEMREGPQAGHSKRVAEHARALAQRMNLAESDVQDVVFAALLHDIGKIGWSDSLMRKPFSALTSEERTEVVKHPIKGQATLMALEQLQGAAKLIRYHHERFDGKGYPDGLGGLDIPMGARILAVVNDYDAFQNGSLVSKPMQAKKAMQYILETRGSRYDPLVVDAFAELLGEIEYGRTNKQERVMDQPMLSAQLKPGMVMARDLATQEGMLLLSKGNILSAGMIAQLINYEESEKKALTIYVCP